MKNLSSRTGSAILVVLGMTAFLLVSAIAFSAYMRYARLPSSYLRRSSASRLLVKAALARAIDEVDLAVNNNPHPGIGSDKINREPNRTSLENIWYHRVFMGTNGLDYTSMDDKTVSPLCLEALAYIPPPLVNEARFFSRITPTAHWQSLDYDAGRYSFCALDVSDYFDINRMMANEPRASSPSRRISLGYLFETGENHTSAGSGAEAWDEFMEKFRSVEESGALKFTGSTYPLVSLADFNLALGHKGSVGELTSPFYDFLTRTDGSGFYNTSSSADEDVFRRETFVTDGLFPKKETDTSSADDFDITDANRQPFRGDYLKQDQGSLADILMGRKAALPNTSEEGWQDYLSGLGCAALYDYLDPNHVPLSLAIPTVERVPMICGASVNFPGSQFGLTKEYEYQDNGTPRPNGSGDPKCDGSQPTRTVEQVVYYKIDTEKFCAGFNGNVQALYCFPFSHADDKDGTFKLDGRFSLFLTEGESAMRTQSTSDPFHLTTKQIGNSSFDIKRETGLINVKLQADDTIDFASKEIREEKDAFPNAPVELSLQEGENAVSSVLDMKEHAFVSITYEWEQQATPTTMGYEWSPLWDAVKGNTGLLTVKSAHCAWPANVWEGKKHKQLDADMLNDTKLAALLQKGTTSKTLTLDAALWLRIKNKDGKVVDLVPACVADDSSQLDADDASDLTDGLGLGSSYPLMLFHTGVSIDFSIPGLENLVTTPQPVEFKQKTVMITDPRYNHAPEDWYAPEKELSVDTWVSARDEFINGDGECDNDLFMATSDAGYMQSPYEVAMLPRFWNLTEGGDVKGDYKQPDSTVLTEFVTTAANVRNAKLMWKTIDPMVSNRDAFRKLPWSAAGTGYKVNPFSDSTNVLMSVFANTPIDWKRASTNDYEECSKCAADFEEKGTEFNKTYAFNAYNSKAKLGWKDLEKIAGAFGTEARRLEWNWANAFGNLCAADDETRFCGVELSGDSADLWDVDRKFLYGFWSDCFAAKQQLYLIFVRAEPVMMGSGMAGQIPPQLGARAVALVWRDPTEAKDNAPHQTRILFYRQFE